MVESIIKDRRRMIPCAAFVDEKTSKHYSAQGLFIGLPILIGKNGVERIFDINFTAEEKELWNKTVASVKGNAEKVDQFLTKQ